MKKLLITLLLLNISLFANKINLALAANVSYAINDLIKEFNKTNPNTKIQVIYGSSGKLTAQISNGAPYDIFMSANMKYPQALYTKNIAITKPIIYAKGALALISSKDIDLSKNLDFLKDKKINRIAIANPKTAPYGIATVEALKNLELYEALKKKFIYGESISQTVTYALKAADLGFIAKSSLYSDKMKRYTNHRNLDIKLYTPIEQGLVILKQAKNNKDAKAFYDFILSSKAQKIFKEYGYLKP